MRSNSDAAGRPARRSISASTSAGTTPRIPPPSIERTFTRSATSLTLPLRARSAIPPALMWTAMPGPVLDLEQSLLLLELEAPFDKRQVQLARRQMAKRWHPDIAPPGRQHEHERHLKAINEAADQLEYLAEESRGGKVSRNAVRASAMAARKAREEAGRRNYEAQERERAMSADRQKHDPFGARVPDHSVVHRYTRCLSYPEWGVGEVQGIYFTGDGDDVQQWARVKFQVGIRTVPAGSLQFVDFSTPDPGHERVERFMTAAQHAILEENYALAARRLVYARDAAPDDPAVLRLLALAFWQDRDLLAAARAVRDWIRVERKRPAPYRFASRIYEDQGALSLAEEAAEKVVRLAAKDASGWGRLGRLRLRRGNPTGARSRSAMTPRSATSPIGSAPRSPASFRTAPNRRRERSAGARRRAGARGRR